MLLVSCKASPEKGNATTEFNRVFVQQVLDAKGDVAGEAPRNLIIAVYTFYAENSRWPKDEAELRAHSKVNNLPAFKEITFSPQTNGACLLKMKRNAYTISTVLTPAAGKGEMNAPSR
jgi:hypothetical protein